jgi:hypothetical protein
VNLIFELEKFYLAKNIAQVVRIIFNISAGKNPKMSFFNGVYEPLLAAPEF